jgi:hypothetical protein
MPRLARLTLIALFGSAGTLSAQTNSDSAFAEVQRYGAMVMGVDQYTSSHVFEDLPDGGRIVLLRQDTADAQGTATIRVHLRSIADSFAAGVFADPSRVHSREVPGTATMRRLRERISYGVTDRPGGGELRITTTDAQALVAIRRFLAFQRMDHRAPGHEEMQRPPAPR